MTTIPLRRLCLTLDTEEDDDVAMGCLAAAAAGVSVLAPTLRSLDLRWGVSGSAIALAPAGAVARVLAGARLHALTDLTIGFGCVGGANVAAIASACSRVVRCRLDVSFDEGAAAGLGLVCGALPHLAALTLLRLYSEGDDQV